MLRTAIRSVLNQDFADYEVVVSDDASTEDVAAAVESFRDARIRFHRNPQNAGLYPNHNIAWRLARADWVIFLHNDDTLCPDALSQCRQALSAGGEAARSNLFVHYDGAKAAGGFLDGIEAALYHIRRFGKSVSGGCFHRQVLESLAGFETAGDVGYAADWDLLIRAGLAGHRLGLLESPMASLGSHPEQASAGWFFTARYFRNCGSVLHRSLWHEPLRQRLLSDMNDWQPCELYKLLIVACSLPDMEMACRVSRVACGKELSPLERRALKHFRLRKVLGRRLYWLALEVFYRLGRRQEAVFSAPRQDVR
jgi:glycosyltransferase involved in cell wall biosynthesis